MLIDTRIRALRAKDKSYKTLDGHGLHLSVSENGSKYWRQKYRFNGIEKLLSHSDYQFISLAAARLLRGVARTGVNQGEDPAIEKKSKKRDAPNNYRL